MKKVGSVELFRIPGHNYYSIIKGKDFVSSGIVTVSDKIFAPGSSFESKGILKHGEQGFALDEGVSNVSIMRPNENLSMEEIVSGYLEEDSSLFTMRLSRVIRNGGIYAFYREKRFLFLPSHVMEYLIKNISPTREVLKTNGRCVFLINKIDGEVLAVIESIEDPDLTEEELNLFKTLSLRG